MIENDEMYESQSAAVATMRRNTAPALRGPRPGSAVIEADAQRVTAEVQAAIITARRFPREEASARDRILIEFARPSVAESALYNYAKGGTAISGLSIRAAEAIVRHWGNIHREVRELERHPGGAIWQAVAWDMQTNTREARTFWVPYQRVTRDGSYEITDPREQYELGANYGARRLRACMLGLIPADIQDDAREQAEATLKARVEVTPAKLKSMVDKFGEHGVTQAMIEARIQRKLDAIAPAQVVQLSKIFNSIRDGMSKAGDWFDMAPGKTADGQGEPEPRRAPRGVEGLRRRMQNGDASEPANEATPPAESAEPVDIGDAPEAPPPEPAPAVAREPQPGPNSYAVIRHAIEHATSLAALDAAYQRIAKSEPASFRAELAELAEQAQVRLASRGAAE